MTEKYSPWTVVNVVFRHLAESGLHPVLGESGDPSAPAAPRPEARRQTPPPPPQRPRPPPALIRQQFVPADPPDERADRSG